MGGGEGCEEFGEEAVEGEEIEEGEESGKECVVAPRQSGTQC